MTALVVSISSINPSFANELKDHSSQQTHHHHQQQQQQQQQPQENDEHTWEEESFVDHSQRRSQKLEEHVQSEELLPMQHLQEGSEQRDDPPIMSSSPDTTLMTSTDVGVNVDTCSQNAGGIFEGRSTEKNAAKSPSLPYGVPRSTYSLDDMDEEEDDGASDNDICHSKNGVCETSRSESIQRLPSTHPEQDLNKQSSEGDEQDVADHATIPSLATNNDLMDVTINTAEEGELDDAFIAPAPLFESISSPTDVETPKLPYGGLENMGNTCYLNSAFQMIASLDGFVPLLEEYAPEHIDSSLRAALLQLIDNLQEGKTIKPIVIKQTIDERSPLFIGYRQQDAHEFITTLLDLMDEDYKKTLDEEMKDADEEETKQALVLESAQDPSSSSSPTTSPIKKQRLDTTTATTCSPPLISTIPSTGSLKDLQFQDIENLLHGQKASYEQSPVQTSISAKEDGGPKCKLFGGRMDTSGASLTPWNHDGDNDVTASSDIKPASDEAVGEGSSTAESEKPYSPIDETFTTEVRVCLTCESCKYRRSHLETYLHLSLEIGPSITSIEEGIKAFFKPEKREIKCEKCFYESAMQTTEITKLPRSLLFHLKRFIVDVSPDYTSISYRKDQSPVSFEPYLAIDEDSGVIGEVTDTNEVYFPSNARYGIRSVVNHIGSSASCGHYTADAFRSDKCGNRDWVRFNDEYVSRVSQQDAVNNAKSTAYMVLYELEEYD